MTLRISSERYVVRPERSGESAASPKLAAPAWQMPPRSGFKYTKIPAVGGAGNVASFQLGARRERAAWKAAFPVSGSAGTRPSRLEGCRWGNAVAVNCDPPHAARRGRLTPPPPRWRLPMREGRNLLRPNRRSRRSAPLPWWRPQLAVAVNCDPPVAGKRFEVCKNPRHNLTGGAISKTQGMNGLAARSCRSLSFR